MGLLLEKVEIVLERSSACDQTWNVAASSSDRRESEVWESLRGISSRMKPALVEAPPSSERARLSIAETKDWTELFLSIGCGGGMVLKNSASINLPEL
jgi:hypothetical protein